MKTAPMLGLTLLLLAPDSGFAQSRIPATTPLAEVLFTLYRTEINTNISAGAQREAALSDLSEALILTQAISNQLSSFPLGSSAGGFTWTFNQGTGLFARDTGSFGPIFAERALTVGRGKMNLGFNYQHTSYRSFEGRDLDNGDIVFYTPFTASIIGEDALSLDVSTDTLGVFANYGVTDRLDVGAAVPIVHAKMDASIRFLFRDASGAQAGTFQETTSGGGSASGIGDIVLRAKYKALDLPGGGVAAAVDLRVPTGSAKDLLGIAGTQVKVYGILSTRTGNVSPHVNVGYTVSRPNGEAKDPASVFLEPPNEFGYALGADFAVSPRLTLAGDLIGRTQVDVPRLTFQDVGLGPRFQEFSFNDTGTLHVGLVSLGVKYNLWNNLLVSASVLVPVSSGGLRSNATPVIGIDWSF